MNAYVNDPYALFAIIAVSAAFGYWIDSTKWGRRVPGILVSILIPTVLTSTSVMPSDAPIYSTLGAWLIPLAIPLLLFQADFRRIYRIAGLLLLLFGIASLSTLIGVAAGVLFFDLGPDEPAIAAVLSASYIGGSSNLVAVSQMVDFHDPASLSVAFAADAVGGISFMILIMTLPTTPFLRRFFRSDVMADAAAAPPGESSTETPLRSTRMLTSIAASAVIVAASALMAERFGLQNYTLLFVSGIALVIANLFPRQLAMERGAEEAGLIFIYLYMPVIGAFTDLRSLSANSLDVIAFALTIVSVHVGVLLLATRLFALDVAEALIASNAAILGGPTASAMAATFKWRTLITPGMLCGILGNAIANFIGVSVFRLMV
ncbi:MAG: DUF819 family protein [Alphaproteobacteria bacterium]|nr:DUF819 family protein [Alphaproteobacteria bacterium]